MKGFDEQFVAYEGEAYILIVSNDKKSWWTERLIGFSQTRDEDGDLGSWVASFVESGGIQTTKNQNFVDIVYGRLPTEEDAKKVRDGECLDSYGGEFAEESVNG